MVDVNPQDNNINITVSSAGTNTSAGIGYSAETYADIAKMYANQASNSATNSSNYATNSSIWAEGTDAQVATLGGEHSAKGWAELSENANISLSNLNATGEAHFQQPLVSGTNIKTINSNSILGSGNLDIDGLPSQIGQSGKYLTTDGTNASWGNITAIASSLLDAFYPVGTVYSTVANSEVCPLASIGGTWELVASGKALWTGNGSNGGNTIAAGLPNLTGVENNILHNNGVSESGVFSNSSIGTEFGHDGGSYDNILSLNFNASSSNSIYGQSETVQPPAIVVNTWKRTA